LLLAGDFFRGRNSAINAGEKNIFLFTRKVLLRAQSNLLGLSGNKILSTT
jgi:hypothetical protein